MDGLNENSLSSMWESRELTLTQGWRSWVLTSTKG